MDSVQNLFSSKYSLLWKNSFISFISIVFIYHTYYAPFIDEDCRKIISPSIENEEHTRWWPSHCSLKEYTNKSIFKCFEERRKPGQNFSLVFMGDSHMGSLAISFNLKIGSMKQIGKWYQNSSQRFLHNKTLKFEYKVRKIHSLNDSFHEIFKQWEDINYTPDLLVMNCNLHPIIDNRGSNEGLNGFRRNLTRQLLRLNKMAMKSPILWYVQPPISTPRSRNNLTNYNVDRYNAMVIQVLRDQRVHLWTSPRRIAVGELQNYDNDVHIPRYQVNRVLKILLNYLCNSYSNETSNNICCSKREGLYLTYFNKYSIFITCSAVFLVFISSFKPNISLGSVVISSPFVPKTKVKKSKAFQIAVLFMLKTGVYFSLVYFCVRTPIIPREEKHSDFPLISSAITFTLLFICQKEIVESQNLNEVLLSEAKGVLISFLMFLKLYETNSSKSSELIKSLLESSLLVFTGAEMFHRFWRKEFSGLIHFLIEIIPVNILLVILCWILDKNLEFYDLMPVLAITYPLFSLPLLLPIHKGKDSPIKCLICHFLKTSTVLVIMFSTSRSWERDFLFMDIMSNFFLNQDGVPDTAIQQWIRNKYCLGVGVLGGILTELFQLTISSKFQGNTKNEKRRIKTLFFFALGCSPLTLTYFLAEDKTLMDLQILFPLHVIHLIACYFLLRHLLLNLRQDYNYAFYRIGNTWLQIYVIHFHTILSFGGRAILQMISFPSFLNDVLLFSMTVILGLELQEMLSVHIGN